MAKEDALTRAVDQNDIAALALQAIDSVTNLSNQYMTYTTYLIGLFALIGLGVIFGAVRWYARDAGKKCANEHMQRYIDNGGAQDLLATLVEEAVQREFSRRIITNIHPQKPSEGGPRFSRDPRFRPTP